MSWSASERYRVRPAPAGLALVQDLSNTRAIKDYAPDLLGTRAEAERWLRAAARQWSDDRGLPVPGLEVSAADLPELRRLRAEVQGELLGDPAERSADEVGVRLVTAVDGRVRMLPTGAGWRWLASAVRSETLLAQEAGTLPRLKLCRNDQCRSAFYDSSRNNSGVWHDVHTCGNVANLRASRERKRLRAIGADADERG